ncbi:alpha/beta fold hydrolase [Thalassolituus sp. LLYu03]|uniref:alpha/beta fold hydrolase n=1 Tax=Thalassolituus sp. LLYu03 TaxID=3421656 RepID=UPI003D27E3CD
MTADIQLCGQADWPVYVFAHGAGAGQSSDFMQAVTAGLNRRGIAVARFEFPYMARMQAEGTRRPPDKLPVLDAHYRNVLAQLNRPCVIGGKSMGGRVASLLLADDSLTQVLGCACLGFPFHPAGKPDTLRTEHLKQLTKPLLMVQGTRDALGNQLEVAGYNLSPAIQWLWLTDGDHDLKPRKASGFTQAQHIDAACERVAQFINSLSC